MGLWLRQLFFVTVMATILFGSAGRFDLPWFWALMAVHATAVAMNTRTIDPGLARERWRPGPGGRDRHLRGIAMPFYLAHLVVAGLDVGRFGWSGTIPLSLRALGLIGYAAGIGLVVWAMSANTFFSPVPRIQRERGHRVITGGPYRYLRHPGYAGGLLTTLCGGIALGSWWSLLPLAPVALFTLRRTVLEDRLLKADLEGYARFAERVRFRLLPGVW